MFKQKYKIVAISILLCIFLLLLSCANQFSAKYDSYADTSDGAIANLWSNGHFEADNLNLLATKVGYNNLNDLLVNVAGDSNANAVGVKNATDFGNTRLKLGTYTAVDGTLQELEWFPTYLSKSADGDVVLTLWLAQTANANGGNASMQEISGVSDGWHTITQLYEETYTTPVKNEDSFSGNVYNNAYDASFMRHRTLNCDNNYLGPWGNNNITEENKVPINISNSKFAAFNAPDSAGYLSEYIVTPNEMGENSWQMTESSYRNDPSYAGADAENFPSGWVNDKVWMPSITELFCTASYPDKYDPPFDGGIWGTDKAIFTGNAWLRSTCTVYLHYLLLGQSIYVDAINYSSPVRPAIHLNLTKASTNMVHIHNMTHTAAVAATCTTDGNIEYWYCDGCNNFYSDKDGNNQITESSTKIPASHNLLHIAAVAPTCTAQGNSEYWECSACGKYFSDSDGATEITAGKPVLPVLGHSFTIYVSDKNATCTADGTKTAKCDNCVATDTIADTGTATGHSWSSGWTVDGANHWHICNNGCGEKSGKTAHTWATAWSKDTTNHWHECTVCGTDDGKAAHNFVWITDKQATVTSTGLKHEECTCGEQRSLNTVIPVQTCNHSFTNYVSDGNATCTADGTKTAQCDYGCGTTDTVADEGSAMGHTAGADATCTTAQTCTVCGVELVAALGHDWTTEWCKDKTNHWHECTVCGEKKDDEAHAFEWVITKQPTVDETGLKQNICSVCGEIDGEEEIAKLVEDPDGNGNVSDLPPDNDYELEIAVKESDSLYNIAGVNKGFKVELFVVDGDDRTPYDASKTVNLMLVVPEGMEEFTLYIRRGDILEIVAPEDYTVKDRIVTIRTTLPNEFVFNSPLTEEPEESGGIPWWVWLIVGLAGAAVVGVVTVIIVVIKKKNGGNSDNGEVLKRLGKQDEKIDRLIEITDGGFNDIVDEE